MIVLATRNRWKIAEYRRFLARHGQALIVEAPTEDPATLATWLQGARLIEQTLSRIVERTVGELVRPILPHAIVREDEPATIV
jgi:hypothetical protein